MRAFLFHLYGPTMPPGNGLNRPLVACFGAALPRFGPVLGYVCGRAEQQHGQRAEALNRAVYEYKRALQWAEEIAEFMAAIED